MERYSLIVVADSTKPIRRFDVRKDLVRRALMAAAIAVCLVLVGLVDYVRVRVEHGELPGLRAENAEQRRQIESFSGELSAVESDLERLRELERKVRIIANLPGAAASGGEIVTAVGNASGGDLEAGAGPAADVADTPETPGAVDARPPPAPAAALEASDRSAGDPISALREDAERLSAAAGLRAESLTDLLGGLEAKRHRLASTPAIWPAKGWMTSRFGNRVSPFTGARQFHGGIDIAGARGTDVIAPARGKVSFVGNRGPLGRSLTIDHGFGVRTTFGHNDETFVDRGQQVERGEVVASLGNSGRSTGPHLHYVVEVNGKAVNPLDYIFD
jgi:murein DD-endopeptidase MepM/ murein hydrolase activator NlpD